MRIAYDAASLLSPRTGVGHFAATLLERLLEIESDDTYLLYAFVSADQTEAIPTSDRVRFYHRRIPARVAVTGWELLGRPSAERVLGPADVVHGPNFWIPPSKKLNGMITIHDMTFIRYPELCTPQVRRYSWIVPRVLRRCALVTTPSETVKAEVAEALGFDEDRIVVTPGGVRGAFAGAAFDENLAQRLGLEGPYILFAGTQEPRKNLDRLIEAMNLVEGDLKLLIVGPPGWGSVDLPALTHKLGLDGRVGFSGYLPDNELASLMAGARAFAFPTIYEGFGLPPLEAMAAGVPVIASKSGSLPEVLGDAPIWCDPESVESIAAAIATASYNDTARLTAAKRGYERASMYDWTRTAEIVFEAYRRVAESR